MVDTAVNKKKKTDSMFLIQHDTYKDVFELTRHVLKRIEEKGWKGMFSMLFLTTLLHR
jgi:hypothetical protein